MRVQWARQGRVRSNVSDPFLWFRVLAPIGTTASLWRRYVAEELSGFESKMRSVILGLG